jgi:hypothetical protein
MTCFQTAPLSEVVKSILEDGTIDDNEVTKLRERLYADGKIDKDEAEALFEINDGVKGKNNSPSWTTLFTYGISEFLLNDETSPGVIDEEESKWLIQKLEGDGEIDDNERKLLALLKSKATSLPDALKAKFADWGV